MQFTTLALAAFASAQAVFAASGSKEFGFLSIRSGSGLQYESIVAEGNELYFGSGSNDLNANVTDCGFLQFQDGSYAYVDQDGLFKKGSRTDAMPGFTIKDGNLEYYGNGFYALKAADGKYKLSSKSSSDALGVLLRTIDVENKSGNTVPDYTPDGTNCVATGPPIYVSKRDVPSVSSANGAEQLGSQTSLGMGAAAAFVAMLL